MAGMDKKTRSYEEIITLQDKAIEALTQANAALVMALEALKKARAEHGFPIQLPGLGGGIGGTAIPNNSPFSSYSPYSLAYVPNTTADMLVTNTAGSQLAAKTVTAQSLIAQAQNQKEMAQAYISAFQGVKKEQGPDAQVGGCISVS